MLCALRGTVLVTESFYIETQFTQSGSCRCTGKTGSNNNNIEFPFIGRINKRSDRLYNWSIFLPKVLLVFLNSVAISAFITILFKIIYENRDTDKSKSDNNRIDQPGCFNHRGIYRVVKPKCLKCRLKTMMKVKSEAQQGDNVGNAHPANFKPGGNQRGQIVV